MNTCKKYQNLLFELFYDELDADTKRELTAHIEGCGECGRHYAEVRSLLEDLQVRERPEPDSDYWESYWERLYPKLTGGRGKKHGVFARVKDMLASLTAQPLGALRLGLLVTASVFIGVLISKAFFFDGAAIPPNGGVPVTESGQAAEERAELFMTRAEVILLGFVNADMNGGRNLQPDFSLHKKYSRILLDESEALKEELSDGRRPVMRELVADLEFALMQIANIEDEYNPDEIRLIQAGVERRALLFKLNLEAIKKSGRAHYHDAAEPMNEI